jgi:hypothetical protein
MFEPGWMLAVGEAWASSGIRLTKNSESCGHMHLLSVNIVAGDDAKEATQAK